MLLNFSNHPSANWSPEQRNAAVIQFGSVQDMDFPVVPPRATTDEVQQLAENCYMAIRKVDPYAVHITGEATLTHALVNKLQEAGYPCYVSTTFKNSEIKRVAKKDEFRFVAFRRYTT